MSESLIYSLLCFAAGIFSMVLCIRFYRDKKFAENYVKNSHKALIWRKLFGEEKTLKMIKTIFAPIGIIFSTALILLGSFLIFSTLK
jgi:hypothetical protein